MADHTFIKISSKARDFTGSRYGALTVIGPVARDKGRRAMWLALCDCGGEIIDRIYNISRNTSCGCHRSKRMGAIRLVHGHNRKGKETRTHKSWASMIQRCRNPNSDQYRYYGGLGVKICERWNEFSNFLEDMGERPLGKTIDRIDPYGDYEPGNCRWATAKEQRANQRDRSK